MIDIKQTKFQPEIFCKENQILLDTVRSSSVPAGGSFGQTENISKQPSMNILTNFSLAKLHSGTTSPAEDIKGLVRNASGQD